MKNEMLEHLCRFGLQRGWDKLEAKWGRTGSSSLLAHSLTVVGITETLLDVIDIFDESDRKVAMATSFFHDMLKDSSSSKEKIEEKGRLMDKCYSMDDFESIKNVLNEINLTEGEVRQIISILPHGAIQGIEHLECLLERKDTKDNPEIRRLVHEVADILASKKSIDDFSDLGTLKDSLNHFGLDLKYHKVSVIRGVLTSLLHKTMHQIYDEAGYTPVLFYPEGTVYVSHNDDNHLDMCSIKDDFHQKLWNNLIEYIEETPTEVLGSEASGPYTQTKIPSPQLAYLSDKTVEVLWNHIRARKTISDPDIKKNYNDYVKILGEKDITIPDEDALVEDLLKETIGLFVIFYYFKEVCMHSSELDYRNWEDKWNNDDALCHLKKVYEKMVNDDEIKFEEFLATLSYLSHAGPGSKNKRIESGLLFRKILPTDRSREEVLGDAVELCKNFTLSLRSYADENHGLKSVDIPTLLLQEITQPIISSNNHIVDDIWDKYNEGKLKDGNPLCSVCGRPSTMKITGKKVGPGEAKSFTNLFAGGETLQNRNICGLCDLEMTIRSLYTRSGDIEEYYLIPQINMSVEVSERWNGIIGEIVNGHKRFGINPVTEDITWSRILTDNTHGEQLSQPITNPRFTSKLLKNIWKGRKKSLSKMIRNIIEDYIQSDFNGNLEEFIESENLSCNEIDELVELALSGDETIFWHIGDKLEEINEPKGRNLFAMITPNYALISYPLRKNEKDDHNSANYIRHLFRSALLSKLFLASVIVKELRYEPLMEMTPKGAVKIPSNIQFDKAFSKTNICLNDGWLGFEYLDEVLLKLSALFRLDSEIGWLSPSGKSQKGNLVTILNDPPGRTLHRMEQLSSDKKRPHIPLALDMVNILFEKGGTK